MQTIKEAEGGARREAIEDALRQTEGNRTLAAEQLGVSRSQLHRYMRDLGMIEKPKPKAKAKRAKARAR